MLASQPSEEGQGIKFKYRNTQIRKVTMKVNGGPSRRKTGRLQSTE
jgi:hypothetical protein